MRTKYLIFIVLFFCECVCAQHKIINQFKDFVAKADMVCYEQKIQKDLNKFDEWLIDSLPKLNKFGRVAVYRPENVDLQKENKIFALAVSLANTENYNFEDDIYDYLVIDSLRTFIIVCVDKKMNVIGITDVDEPGTFNNLKDDFYYYPKKRRNEIRAIIKNINKENPDLIMYCDNWWSSFLYIKDETIYCYNVKTGKSKEFNKEVRGCPSIDMVRTANILDTPYAVTFSGKSHSYSNQITGHTSLDEMRLCPPQLSKKED